jgi:hypothetical protein
MSKNLKVVVLLIGAGAGVFFGHQYKPNDLEVIALGAIFGALIVKMIIDMADSTD